MVIAWSSFFSIDIIAIAPCDNSFVNKSGVESKSLPMAKNDQKSNFQLDGGKMGWRQPGVAFSPQISFQQHLVMILCDPLILPPLLLRKMFSPGACAKITMKRELLESITPLFSGISLKIEILVLFQPFFSICDCLWATP